MYEHQHTHGTDDCIRSPGGDGGLLFDIGVLLFDTGVLLFDTGVLLFDPNLIKGRYVIMPC
jgi:hypothetical protein